VEAQVPRDARGDVQKLRQLSEENARLKKVVGNMALEVDALKDALEKNS